MFQLLLETILGLHSTNKRRNRTARPNLALPDRLQPAEATKAGRLEVATGAADLVEGAVATEALLHPAEGDRSSSTMSVILNPFLIPTSELSLTRLM